MGHLQSPISNLPPTIDFVTARTEFYTEPTALPEVAHGSIKLDLHRRDFAINTLAVRLDGAFLGQLLDFYGGQQDLADGVIRVLHSLSFVDDPTRILRAVRLEQRLKFHIEPRTLELIKDALPLLDRVSGARMRHEIELTLHEAEPTAALSRLSELDVLAHIDEGLVWLPETAVFFQRVPRFWQERPWCDWLADETPLFTYFALWLAALPEADQRGVTEAAARAQGHQNRRAGLQPTAPRVGDAARHAKAQRGGDVDAAVSGPGFAGGAHFVGRPACGQPD
jgi:tRNA nucleotidyltransferase/poly(A) polymerase